jgi:hypothetical protein
MSNAREIASEQEISAVKHVFTAILLSAGLAGAALAQTPSQPEPASNQEVLVVTAPTRQAIQTFVGSLASTPQYADQMGRWDRHICPGVIGLHREQAQFIVDRIARRAIQVGLRPGNPGCRADIAIFVTPDAQLFAREFVHNFGRVMARYHDVYVSTPGEAALDEFQNDARPVRWWHVSEMMTRDGHLFDAAVSPPDRGMHVPGAVGTVYASAPMVRFDGTRLRRPTHQDFQRVIIVVDARQVEGVRVDALSDYLAMVALAQLKPDQDVSGFPTILNLFAPPGARTTPTQMSDWDVAYLQGVYHMQRPAVRAQYQRADIARTVDRDLQDHRQPAEQ